MIALAGVNGREGGIEHLIDLAHGFVTPFAAEDIEGINRSAEILTSLHGMKDFQHRHRRAHFLKLAAIRIKGFEYSVEIRILIANRWRDEQYQYRSEDESQWSEDSAHAGSISYMMPTVLLLA